MYAKIIMNSKEDVHIISNTELSFLAASLSISANVSKVVH